MYIGVHVVHTVHHMLNMEISKVCLGSMSRDVHSCIHWLRTRNPLNPSHFGLIRGCYCMVSKDRRHSFVTPCCCTPNSKCTGCKTFVISGLIAFGTLGILFIFFFSPSNVNVLETVKLPLTYFLYFYCIS